MRKWVVKLTVALVVLFGAIQLVPYGRDHSNPPVTREIAWDSSRTRELAVGACYDCHSNLTAWPWYTNMAPVSWLVSSDVERGRAALNFSEWNRPQEEGETEELVEVVREGSMPPWQYEPLHPAGRLTDAERDALAQGLARTLVADPPIGDD